jgi:heme/copper-type cytochrome/quinol oxidase subunit 2
MTDSVSTPETAQAEPQKPVSEWEIIFRTLVILVGIFLGVVVALFIALSTGWIQIC